MKQAWWIEPLSITQNKTNFLNVALWGAHYIQREKAATYVSANQSSQIPYSRSCWRLLNTVALKLVSLKPNFHGTFLGFFQAIKSGIPDILTCNYLSQTQQSPRFWTILVLSISFPGPNYLDTSSLLPRTSFTCQSAIYGTISLTSRFPSVAPSGCPHVS